MTNPKALEQFLHEYHRGMDKFMRGSCEGVKPLFSLAEIWEVADTASLLEQLKGD